MNKQQKTKKSSKNKFIISGIIIAVIAIGIGLALNNQSSVPSQSAVEPRTISWQHVHGLGVNPSDPSILYIGTHGDFFQSISGGPPVKVDKVRADYMGFTVPSVKGTPLYSSGHPSTGGNAGLIKSTDGGQTWELVSKVLEPPVDFHAKAVSKSDPNIIIGFDSGGRGLFKTTDAGISWETLQYPDYVSALAISPTDPNMVFAGTGKGIFVSNDGAKSWTQLEPYNEILIFALTFDDNGVLYATAANFGLLRSLDLGKTWEGLKSPDLTITNLAVDSQNKIIYVAGHSQEGFQEVYSSSNDGTNWQLIGTNKEL